MTEIDPAQPLHNLIRRVRKPDTLRELMAACLRSAYVGTPMTAEGVSLLPQIPSELAENVAIRQESIAGLRCVVYAPKAVAGPLPLLLYMHGGGFVIGCSEDTDYTTRMLCASNQMIVVSVNYRLAPETMYPGALLDCWQVLVELFSHCSDLKIDPSRLYLSGDSAGGNLAMSLAQRLNLEHLALVAKLPSTIPLQNILKGIILFAPWLDMEVEKYASFNSLAPTGVVFDAPFIAYSRAAYVHHKDRQHPHVSPINADLKELAPTLVIIGSGDPLFDQAVELRRRAQESGSAQIQVVEYEGMPHCFYSFPSLFSEEQDCYRRISEFVRKHA